MKKKNIIVSLLLVCIAGAASMLYLSKKDVNQTGEDVNISVKKNISEQVSAVSDESNDAPEAVKQKNIKKEDKIVDVKSVKDSAAKNDIKKAEMFNDTPSSVLPLSAIALLAELPDNVKDSVVAISKSNDIYLVQKHNDKLFIITSNPENIRHSVEFTEISLANGHQTRTTLGYNGKINDSENDIWEYDSVTSQPLRHSKYNSNGDIEFVELWNYDDSTPVKYQMKDSNGKVISMRNETISDGTNLRVEHLLYDNDGNTKINVSATYEGDDIKRFTYYNADKLKDSVSIFSDYSDGLKTKETVYSSDLKVKNTYTSDYKDGNRENIIIWDNQNQEIKKYLPKDSQ